MSNPKNTPTPTDASAPANPAPEQPGAKHVASAIATVVDCLSHLPAALQLRALQGAATALGVDKEQRGRTSTPPRNTTNNSTQQRGSNR